MPHDGEMILTPQGKAIVMSTQTIREQVKVRLIVDESGQNPTLDDDITVFKKAEITRIKKKKPNIKEEN
jgi:hypothetical protein